MFIDTHCHIYPSEMENAEEIIKKCNEEGIILILNGIDKKSNEEIIELCSKYNNCYGALGYDHSVVNEITEDDIVLLDKQLKNDKIVAVGEIGLDYYWIKDNKETQKELFEKMLVLAEKNNLPVIVHAREAIQDTYDILKKHKVIGSMHCYQGSIEMAKEFIKLGFYIGIDGPITYKNNKKQRELVKNIDKNYILVETDSPYLSPEPVRGSKNTSLNLIYIIKKIAEELEMTDDEIISITTNNARRLYERIN